MRKPGTNPDNVQMTDVLCDFCQAEWTLDRPFIEGHQGSVICGRCITVACTDVILSKTNTAPAGYKCTMCLENRADPGWQSPMHAEAVVCARCIDLAAEAAESDKELNWKRPGL